MPDPFGFITQAMRNRQAAGDDPSIALPNDASIVTAPLRTPQGFTRDPGIYSSQGFLIRGLTQNDLARTGGIATLQNNGGVSNSGSVLSPAALGLGTGKDPMTPDEYTASPLLFNQSPDQLAKQQIVRGGAQAQSIISDLSNGAKPTQNSAGFDYSHLTPIKDPNDLLSNEKFIRLAQVAPDKAATLFKATTGENFSTYVSDKQKQKDAMEKGWESELRTGIVKGDLRRNPTMGWLERKRVIPDPMNLNPPKVTWDPVDPTILAADKDYAAKGTGYARPNMQGINVLEAVPPTHQALFLQEFYDQKNKNADDLTALKAARDKIANTPITPEQMAMANQQPQQPPFAQQWDQGMTDAESQMTPNLPSGQAYQDFATKQASNTNVLGLVKSGLQGIGNLAGRAISPIADTFVGTNDAGRIIENKAREGMNIVRGNIPMFLGAKKPLAPWLRPLTREEYIARQQQRAAAGPVIQDSYANGLGFDMQ